MSTKIHPRNWYIYHQKSSQKGINPRSLLDKLKQQNTSHDGCELSMTTRIPVIFRTVVSYIFDWLVSPVGPWGDVKRFGNGQKVCIEHDKNIKHERL